MMVEAQRKKLRNNPLQHNQSTLSLLYPSCSTLLQTVRPQQLQSLIILMSLRFQPCSREAKALPGTGISKLLILSSLTVFYRMTPEPSISGRQEGPSLFVCHFSMYRWVSVLIVWFNSQACSVLDLLLER